MLLSTSPIILAATAWIILLTPVVHAGWINDLRPRASNTPQSCTATCPNKVGGSTVDYSNIAGNTLTCEYPAYDGYCKYNTSTGLLSDSAGISNCPGEAPSHSCTPTKRSSATKRMTVAAKPQPAAAPLNLRSLSALKKSKLAARDLRALETEE
ncbi:hypothetical protein FRB93_006770 [Tulasnella sp. JGI-2019a]|nr:hypothetical protein FRB93_006770 [Tulasnella sp. JGI-2019a]